MKSKTMYERLTNVEREYIEVEGSTKEEIRVY